jgi:hypothetical protein
MSSYVDVMAPSRRRRYHAAPLSRRQLAALKAAGVAIMLASLWLVLIRDAYGGGRTGTERIQVQAGQSLWSIAQDRYPDEDPRTAVGQIVQLNHLGDQPIYGGEVLVVPAR